MAKEYPETIATLARPGPPPLDELHGVFTYFKRVSIRTSHSPKQLGTICSGASLNSHSSATIAVRLAYHWRGAGWPGSLLAILRWAATPPARPLLAIQNEMKEVELVEIVIRTSLLLKKEMRREVSDLFARPKTCTGRRGASWTLLLLRCRTARRQKRRWCPKRRPRTRWTLTARTQ